MAFVYNPKTKGVVSATKKGTSSSGKQIWRDKESGTQFTTDLDADKLVDQKTGQLKKNAKTRTKPDSGTKSTIGKVKGKTVIKVNNNEVKTVSGTLTEAEAFAMVHTYFKEITNTKAEVSSNNGVTTYTFTVRTGTKG